MLICPTVESDPSEIFNCKSILAPARGGRVDPQFEHPDSPGVVPRFHPNDGGINARLFPRAAQLESQQCIDLSGTHHRLFTFSDLDAHITQLVAGAFEHIKRHDRFAIVGAPGHRPIHAGITPASTPVEISDRFGVFVQFGFVQRARFQQQDGGFTSTNC